MEVAKCIEKYVGRSVDFTSEVILLDKGDGVITIDKWNISGKAKPSMSQLETIWNADKVEIKRQEAYSKAKDRLWGTWQWAMFESYLQTDTAAKKLITDISKMTEAELDEYLRS